MRRLKRQALLYVGERKEHTVKRKNTSILSLPETRKVRGCVIKRLPLGRYIQALEVLRAAADDLAETCFPDKNTDEIFSYVTSISKDSLLELIGNAAPVALMHITQLASALTGIDEQKLLNDPGIGPDGLVEILTVWVEVNRLGDFPGAVRNLIGKFRTAVEGSPQPNIGSNA